MLWGEIILYTLLEEDDNGAEQGESPNKWRINVASTVKKLKQQSTVFKELKIVIYWVSIRNSMLMHLKKYRKFDEKYHNFSDDRY